MISPDYSFDKAAEAQIANVPQPEISVVIVSWNTRRYLEECLQSLGSGISRHHEIIVIDNGSTDGSADMVSTLFPSVTLVQTEANLGFSKANNIGIQRARGDYIALINSDVHVLSGCLDRLASYLDGHFDVGMVGPRIMYGDGRLQSSARHFPGLWNTFCQTVRLNRLFRNSRFFTGEHMFYFAYDQVRTVEVLVGCFILARRAAIQTFGGLDEDFFMYGEDIDWSRRCKHSGWKIVFCPDAEAIHYGGASAANDPVRFELAQLDSRLRLWRKHYPRWKVWGLYVLLNLQYVLRLSGALVGGVKKHEILNVRARNQLACMRALWSRT